MDQNKVYVGLSTSNSWISRIIRWFTKSRASHSFFLFWDETFGKWQTAGADATGFEIVSIDNFLTGNSIVAVYEPLNDLKPVLPTIDAWLATPYDYTGLFGMALVEIGKWLKRKWNNPWNSSKSMFCSEAVAKALLEAEEPNFNLVPEDTAPADLDAFFIQDKAPNMVMAFMRDYNEYQ